MSDVANLSTEAEAQDEHDIQEREEASLSQDDKPVININVHADDARCTVLMAVMKSLIMNGNRPCSPKELAAYILKHRLCTLGGQTPYATVSSRISQHFKRCNEASRRPLLGKKPITEPNRKTNPRRWRYFVDQPGVPVGDDSVPIEEIEPLIGMTGADIEQWKRRHSGEMEASSSNSVGRPSRSVKTAQPKKRLSSGRGMKNSSATETPVRREPDSPPPSAQGSNTGSPEREDYQTPSIKRDRVPQQEASPYDEEAASGAGPNLPPTFLSEERSNSQDCSSTEVKTTGEVTSPSKRKRNGLIDHGTIKRIKADP